MQNDKNKSREPLTPHDLNKSRDRLITDHRRRLHRELQSIRGMLLIEQGMRLAGLSNDDTFASVTRSLDVIANDENQMQMNATVFPVDVPYGENV